MADKSLLRLPLYVAIAIGIIASLYLGKAIGSSDVRFLSEIVGGAVLIAWLVFSRQYWWLPMAFGIGIGGFFTIPFKIYPHEFALGLSIAALIPQIVLYRSRMKANRRHLSIIFYALGAYLLAHYAICVFQYRSDGAGNVSRAYMNAIWPFIFGYYFWRYGSSGVLRTALRVIYIAALIRMSFGLINYFAGKTYVIPGINYSIDPQDLRASGEIVLALALAFAIMRGNGVLRFANGVMVPVASWVVLLGGSRAGAAMLLFVPIFTFAIFRRWVLVWSGALCAVLLIIMLNAYPKLLEHLPYSASRAASIVLVHEKLDVQESSRASDEWHVRALPSEGYKRWARNLKTELFGTAIKPYRPVVITYGYYQEGLYRAAEVSADMGAYESGFWTVLAVLGAAGLVLYLGLLLWLVKQLLPLLLARKSRDTTWGILFWACLAITSWLVFSIPAGSYPSFEIFLGLLALAAVRDEENRHLKQESEKLAQPTRPVLATPRLA